MPYPSAGCQTCKIRRIKCDETKPKCHRCNKSRRICIQTSVAKQTSFSFHVENYYASGKIKRPRGPRSGSTGPHSLDLQTQALTYYVKYHIQALTDVPRISRDLSECVSEWRVSGRTCTMVDLALSFMALAVYSRTQQYPPAATEAFDRYCHLLRITQDRIAQLAIQKLDERKIDACLLVVSLMGRYEEAVQRPSDRNSKDPVTSLQSWCHHDGAMAILKMWNDSSGNPAATFIIKQTRRTLIKSFLLRNLPVPEWMLNGNRFGEHGPELEYDQSVVRLVNLHHASTAIQEKTGPQILTLQKLRNEAREIDKALQDWAVHIPRSCSYQQHILSKPDPGPRTHFYSSVVYSYPTPKNAGAWSQYFAVRMLLYSTFLRILELSRPTTRIDSTHEQQRLECTSQLKAMANNLASSIPFCLERFKLDTAHSSTGHTLITLNANDEIKPYLARLALWPLIIASRFERTDLKQQSWFKSELARLGRITGDGTLDCAESDQTTTPTEGEARSGNFMHTSPFQTKNL